MPDSPARVPSMMCHYVAYLRARAHVTPGVSVDGNRAEVCLGAGDKVLVAVFGCRKQNWSLRSVEVRRGEEAATSPGVSWRRRWPRYSATGRRRLRYWRSAASRGGEPAPRSASGVPR